MKFAIIIVNIFYYNMLQKLIENYYFTENEAKVYLSALQLGRDRASNIAKKSGLNRVTAYEILKRFVQLGIANSAFYGKTKTFTVVAPEVLVSKMENKLNSAREMLPQFSLLNQACRNKPGIAFYEGTEGIRTIYEESLSCKEKIIYNFANSENLLQAVGEDFFTRYVKRRVKRKIKVKVLIPHTETSNKFKNEENASLREIKFFDPAFYDIPNEILVYDNKTVLLSFSTLIGVVVTDVDIAKSLKSIWKMVWNK